MKKNNKRKVSKLPRFNAPKRMISVEFKSKKDKAQSRQALNRISGENAEDD